MNEDDFKRWERYAADASPAPWGQRFSRDGQHQYIIDANGNGIFEQHGLDDSYEWKVNAALVWNYRTAVPALIAEIRRLQSELAAARDSGKFWREAWEAIPTGALFDYWHGSAATTPDAEAAQDELGEWVEQVQHSVNVGRYYAGLPEV